MNSSAMLLMVALATGAVGAGVTYYNNSSSLESLERRIALEQRKFERLESRYVRQAKELKDARKAGYGTRSSLISMAAFEIKGNPQTGLQQKSTDARIVELEEERAELLAALDDTQKKLLKSREKVPAVTINYYRPDKEYFGWGVHATGPAAAGDAKWDSPQKFRTINEFGVSAKITLAKDYKSKPLEFVIHKGNEIDAAAVKDPSLDKLEKALHTIDALKHKNIYLISGVSEVFYNRADAVAALKTL